MSGPQTKGEPVFVKNLNTVSFSKRSLHHLCRRAGVQRVHYTLYRDITEIMKDFISDVVRDAAVRSFHARRKRVKTEDVQLALNKIGVNAYGYSRVHPNVVVSSRSSAAERRKKLRAKGSTAYEPDSYW